MVSGVPPTNKMVGAPPEIFCDLSPCPIGQGSVNNFLMNKRIKKEKLFKQLF
jgi:hypothetical protein